MSAHLQLEVLAVTVPSSFSAEAVQLLAGAMQVELQELVRPRQLKWTREASAHCQDAISRGGYASRKHPVLMSCTPCPVGVP